MTAKEIKQEFLETYGYWDSNELNTKRFTEHLNEVIKAYCKEQRELCAATLDDDDFLFDIRFTKILTCKQPEV